jgi:arsenate reductase (thioredoxin)
MKPEEAGQGVTTVGNILEVSGGVLLDLKAPRVVFACMQNAGRSQMAAALFNLHARGRAWADSAGTRPAKRVHPEVVEVMREIGIDIGAAKPRLLTTQLAAGAVRVVTMGCAEECPVVNAPVEDWGLPDPAGQPLEVVREIRDDIERRVRLLLSTLET